MTAGDSGHRPDRGRRRPGGSDYLDEDGYDRRSGYNGYDNGYQDPAGYDSYGEYRDPDGYDRSGGAGHPRDYGEPYYGDGRYGTGPGYDTGAGYGHSAGYGGQDGYGDPATWADRSGYGNQAGYPDPAESEPYGYQGDPGYGGGYPGPSGYGDPEYGRHVGYDDPLGTYGDPAGGRGRHSAGRVPELPGPDSTDPYGGAAGAHELDPRSYQAGSYGTENGYSAAADPYGAGGYGEAPGYYGELDPQSRRGYDSNPYRDAGAPASPGSLDGYGDLNGAVTGSPSGWAFRPDAAAFGSGAPDDPGMGSMPRADSGAFGRADTGAFDRSDTGASGRPDSGSFGRPDTGAFGRPDTGSFGRPDSGSFGRPDAGSFAPDYTAGPSRRDAGHFGADEEDEHSDLLDSNVHDTGSIRWTAGPPPAKTRSGRIREDAGMAGPLSAEPDGYAQWHHDPAEDWPDEGENGLLSRRFGGGGAPEGPDKGRNRGRNRGRKRRRFRGKAAFTIAMFAVVLVIGIAAAFGYSYVHRLITNRYGDYTGAGFGTVTITVKEGANLVSLGPTLLSKGVIKAVRPYDTAAAAAPSNKALQPGLYKLHHHMNAALAVQYLLGSQARIADTITIIEGTRASDIASILAKRTGYKASQFLQIIEHPPASLGLPSWAGPTAEGFLFPDTYTLTPHEKPMQILQAMVKEFNQKAASINLAQQAAKVFTTPWHVLIVASMVQAEGGRLQDFGGIARVAWNRLKANMPLQFDSTVFYAMGKTGTHITQQEEQFRSPYNTYLNKGLPPGPIGNPGLDAINAALHPPDRNWLYFITDTRPKKPPYKTYFTASLRQLQAWQKEFGN